MKIRTDFVSNSSSSSFIIKDNCVFDIFNITKEDIASALKELIGESKLVKIYDEHVETMKKYYKKADVDRYVRNHPDKNGLFDIYDMHDEKDAKIGHEEYDGLLSGWDATHTGEIREWEKFESVFDAARVHEKHLLAEGEKPCMIRWNYKDRKEEKMPDYLMKTWKFMRKALGIKTRKEVLDQDDTQFLIHFGDNDIYEIPGMAETGKHDKYVDEKEKRKAKWESDAYSAHRFFEILVMKLIEMKKIDPKNKELLKLYLVPEGHWWKRDDRYKGRTSFLKNAKKASPIELVNELDACSEYCMHEG